MNFINTNSSNYQNIDLLGQGSFGDVYITKNMKDEKLYVSKEIPVKDLEENVIIQMFAEAKILEALDHPFIVRLFEFYKTKSQKLVLILEYAQGGDLGEEIFKLKESNKFIEEKTLISKFKRVNNSALFGNQTFSRS